MHALELVTAPPEAPVIGELSLERRRDGRLWASLGGGEPEPVRLVRCFPWSHPTRFISLRTVSGGELAFVSDPDSLAAGSRAALDRAMAEAGFCMRIEHILDVVEEIEIRVWKVVTAQGPRTFQTARDQWPRELSGGSFLIRDVAGDLYVTPDPDTMDAASRRFLWAFVD